MALDFERRIGHMVSGVEALMSVGSAIPRTPRPSEYRHLIRVVTPTVIP